MKGPVLLDSGPLGMASNPNPKDESWACSIWLDSLVAAGVRVLVPAICDYEVRRELLRAKKASGLRRLDRLIAQLEYLSIADESLRRAADFWAQARQSGQPTAGDRELDADMILCAQAKLLEDPEAIIATTNVGHLRLFADADLWQNIRA